MSPAFNVIYIFVWKTFFKQLAVYLAALAAPLATGAAVSYKNGDDAWWDQEIPFPFSWPRFLEISSNTLYDRYSGLEWIADPSELGGLWGSSGSPSTLTWDEAIDACNDLNYGGHSDWRMPNDNELKSLIDYGKDHPAINKQKFKNTQNGEYHSSSMTHHGCANKFFPDMGSGTKKWDNDEAKKRYTRPVRGKLVPWMGGSWKN